MDDLSQSKVPELILAASDGDAGWFSKLLQDKSVETKNEHGQTILHCASIYGHDKILALALPTAKHLINNQTITGHTALHYASNNGHLPAVKLLLSFQADINLKTNLGNNALDLAIMQGATECIAHLEGIMGNELSNLNQSRENLQEQMDKLEENCSNYKKYFDGEDKIEPAKVSSPKSRASSPSKKTRQPEEVRSAPTTTESFAATLDHIRKNISFALQSAYTPNHPPLPLTNNLSPLPDPDDTTMLESFNQIKQSKPIATSPRNPKYLKRLDCDEEAVENEHDIFGKTRKDWDDLAVQIMERNQWAWDHISLQPDLTILAQKPIKSGDIIGPLAGTLTRKSTYMKKYYRDHSWRFDDSYAYVFELTCFSKDSKLRFETMVLDQRYPSNIFRHIKSNQSVTEKDSVLQPNVAVIEVSYFGWPLAFVVAVDDIEVGQELLLDKGDEYWDKQRKLYSMLQEVSGLIERFQQRVDEPEPIPRLRKLGEDSDK